MTAFKTLLWSIFVPGTATIAATYIGFGILAFAWTRSHHTWAMF